MYNSNQQAGILMARGAPRALRCRCNISFKMRLCDPTLTVSRNAASFAPFKKEIVVCTHLFTFSLPEKLHLGPGLGRTKIAAFFGWRCGYAGW